MQIFFKNIHKKYVGSTCIFRNMVVQFMLYGYEYVQVEFALKQVRGEHLKRTDHILQIITVQAEFECYKAASVRGEHRHGGVTNEDGRPENTGHSLLFAW